MAAVGKEDGGGRKIGECWGLDARASGCRWLGASSNMLSSRLASVGAGRVCKLRIVEGWGLDCVTVRDGLGDWMRPSLEFRE